MSSWVHSSPSGWDHMGHGGRAYTTHCRLWSKHLLVISCRRDDQHLLTVTVFALSFTKEKLKKDENQGHHVHVGQ